MRGRRPRIKGFSYKGKFAYFLTICAAEHRPVFLDSELARATVAQILQDATAYRFAVPAYVVMSDHTHWVVEGLSDDSALGPFVKIAKQRTGYAYRQRTRQYLWQPSFHDMVIRDESQKWDVIRYVVENPVRGGLVTSPIDYELWGSSTHSREDVLRVLASRPSRRWVPDESD